VPILDYRPEVTKQVIGILQDGGSICITGEVGIGKTYLARLVIKSFGKYCYGNYRGDNTKCLQQIATSLGINIYQEEDEFSEGADDDYEESFRSNKKRYKSKPKSKPKLKPLTAKELKEEIAENLGKAILICDHFHRWPASLKGWVEDLHDDGAILLLLGSHRDLEGVAYKIPRLVLSPLKDEEIRNIILSQASKTSLLLTTSQVAEIASRAGGNPLLAIRTVQELKQGVESKNVQDSNNYMDITPFLLFIVGLIGTVRFIGMANGDVKLRIFGGIAVTVLFSIRYLGALFPKASRR
jgi:hypothetical protein